MVYNTEADSIREVVVTPNGAWGGEGRYWSPDSHCLMAGYILTVNELLLRVLLLLLLLLIPGCCFQV